MSLVSLLIALCVFEFAVTASALSLFYYLFIRNK